MSVSKEEFKKIEKQYNIWLAKHPKGDYNYKAFSHMRRVVEFAKYYHQSESDKLESQTENIAKVSWKGKPKKEI